MKETTCKYVLVIISLVPDVQTLGSAIQRFNTEACYVSIPEACFLYVTKSHNFRNNKTDSKQMLKYMKLIWSNSGTYGINICYITVGINH